MERKTVNLFDVIFRGTAEYQTRAEKMVAEALATKGADAQVKLPDTAYALPCIYAITGEKITTVGELEHALELGRERVNRTTMLQSALDAGVASIIFCEIIQAIKYLDGNPHEEWVDGSLTDAVVRSFGVALVTQDIPGVAVIIGKHKDPEQLAKTIKSYQNKGLQTYLVGECIDQAREQNIKMGVELRVIPCGYEIEDVINVISVAIRASIMFGNTPAGDWEAHRIYTRDRVMAFVNVFDDWTDKIIAAGAGAIEMGFPAITETYINEVPTLLLNQPDLTKTDSTSLEARGIKIKITEIDCPVSVSSAFEGERVRKDDMKAEFGGNRTKAWELVHTVDLGDIEDHAIEIIGPDIDDPMFDGVDVVRLPLGMEIKVAGKAMQSDFESVLERRLHYFLNYIEGSMHVGQRNISWIRLTKEAFDAGFRLRHFGEVVYAKMLDEFGKVVDKVSVTLYTKEEDVVRLEKEMVKPIYDKRDDRLASLTDESVDQFYTCTLCQSFAPSHVCVVTPERLGLCGAVSWLDSKATKELDPTGPAQPIEKKKVIDDRLGSWEEVNEIVAKCSQGAVEAVTLYSILEDPMTSCGCFECICGIMPEANGVIIVNREFPDMTPTGMTFGELASMTGGGVQTPGFMGHGRHFISSKKFMAAEGGIERIVWMPKELKDDVAERLNKSVEEMTGIKNFTDMVCDETIATDSEAVLEFLTEKGHPALEMDAIM
ncbi:MAG: acetyl-CoA decarbonylase/synthase complex subunit alpha/beta [Eubacterium aggregans]|uniref:CO-methylating acetyl-CoA synthase n=1 Tax=Eubacterium aggregans TaxID=81409 RepID=A0A1H3XIH9_9FIRM|nr:acetyl-CoA decarbonylase/synthase complex subunit alpha/beta [Eubacterium aggregans]MDD4690713.1 acetyl-CoA decarbonylase/synthase complex subunit alpha/beta [Eubacterium aggregans]MEA5072616.1 acetyl-CoA decarbonylase/synthase complex subunit alpha/beta [Eubacterium aggregans]SDZ99156.1 acetyl-CoA decarbonylase/synthase beta subunit [Eubacterium aggregans]